VAVLDTDGFVYVGKQSASPIGGLQCSLSSTHADGRDGAGKRTADDDPSRCEALRWLALAAGLQISDDSRVPEDPRQLGRATRASCTRAASMSATAVE
jgi:hypothetical protein